MSVGSKDLENIDEGMDCQIFNQKRQIKRGKEKSDCEGQGTNAAAARTGMKEGNNTLTQFKVKILF